MAPAPWRRSMRAGLHAVRDGEDYVNNGHRYERALRHLERAYALLQPEARDDDADARRTLARLCLWKGIAHNENMDVKDPAARNDPAIAEYLRGLAHLGREDDAVRMSLHNSLGVAHHHRVGGGVPDPAPIPATSARHYRIARGIYRAWKKRGRGEEAAAYQGLMSKVESNSGRGVMRGGGVGGNVAEV